MRVDTFTRRHTLSASDAARLPAREPDAVVDVQLNGQMQPYAWGINHDDGRDKGVHRVPA